MKFAFMTDIHAFAFNDFSKKVQCKWDFDLGRYVKSDEGAVFLNSRLLNILNAICDVRDYCYKNDIHLVLNGGDTFHRRNIIDVTTFNCVYKVLNTFGDYDIDQIIIAGNHDEASNALITDTSVDTFLSNDIYVSSVPEVMLKPSDGVAICCVPWYKDRKYVNKFIDDLLS